MENNITITLKQISRDQVFIEMLYERNNAILNLSKENSLLKEEIGILKSKSKETKVT